MAWISYLLELSIYLYNYLTNFNEKRLTPQAACAAVTKRPSVQLSVIILIHFFLTITFVKLINNGNRNGSGSNSQRDPLNGPFVFAWNFWRKKRGAWQLSEQLARLAE